ncbi:SLOG family protein [Priestia megaterium]|uniref:SLOG family protein n=1 Tax=Priestia megaterium TaxID=1404 RepID=UPI003670A53E
MAGKQTIRIALTGHRPSRLGGYDYYSPVNIAIAFKLREHLLSHIKQGKKIIAIGGMALGADTIFALVALKLKKQGFPVQFEAAIPCMNHEKKWPKESQEMWHSIVDQADFVTYTSTMYYQPYLMQVRNEYMVNSCDELIAIFDGSKGGTANCVNYAKKKEKKIIEVNPMALVVEVKGDLLKSDCDVMMHQANCQSTMGSGIAKQIKKTFPEVYKVDYESPLSPKEKLGKYTYARVQNQLKPVEVVNLYGQFRYGTDIQHTDYEALRSAIFGYLEDLKKRTHNISDLKVGVPKFIGCARGGGDWNIVKGILEEAAEAFFVRIYTYKLGN